MEVELTDVDTRRIRAIFDHVLPAWDDHTAAGWEAHPRSSLAAEAARFEPTARLVWVSLVSAVDHLKAVQTLWLDAGQVHALASSTLLRAALLAGATAVHYLDDGVGRQERLRRLSLGALSDARDHRSNVEAMAPLAPQLEQTTESDYRAFVDSLSHRVIELEEAARGLGLSREQVRAGLVGNHVIRTAGTVITRDALPSERLALTTGLRDAWQRGSADAHARSWQVVARLASSRAAGDETGLRADVSGLLTALNTAVLVLNQAWRIYDLRR